MKPVQIPTTDVNSESAVITRWIAPDRSQVSERDLIAEVETSKALFEIEADSGGYILHAAPEGSEVALAAPIGHIFESLEELELHAAEVAAGGQEAQDGDRAAAQITEPAAKRARELGIPLDTLPSDRLVTVKVVEAMAQPSDAPAPAPAADLPAPLRAAPGTERVALLGAGLGATQILHIFAQGSMQRAVAILDDDPAKWGADVFGVPVVGGSEKVAELLGAGAIDSAIITISTSVRVRTHLRELCRSAGVPLTNAIDASTNIGPGVVFGTGNVVCAFCHFGAETRVGDNNFISAYNSFDHHSTIGDDISTGPGCMTSGLVDIGSRVRLGTGVFVEPHVSLGDGVQVASGAIILTSVPEDHAVKTKVVTTSVVPLRERT